MNEITADNRPEEAGLEPIGSLDPLDRIDAELDALSDRDPADVVPVLSDVTLELSRELDADTVRS